MATRTLGVALWEYRDQDGRRRRAYYRDTFELPDAEVERGERAGAFAPVEGITQKVTPIEPPAKSSANRVLVDWLVEHRSADRDQIKGLTKAELWQLIQTAEDAAAQQDS